MDVTKSVKKFYNDYCDHFDTTRVRIWKGVREFLSSLNEGSSILECGCGNGKNINYFQKNGFVVSGFDFSENLVKLCQNRSYNVKLGDIRKIPFKDNSFDNIICIAVLHHLDKEVDRILAIKEMMRVCKPGGKILVSVWAVEQEKEENRSFAFGGNMVKYNDTFRYYYIYDEQHIKKFLKKYELPVENFFWEKGNWFFQLTC